MEFVAIALRRFKRAIIPSEISATLEAFAFMEYGILYVVYIRIEQLLPSERSSQASRRLFGMIPRGPSFIVDGCQLAEEKGGKRTCIFLSLLKLALAQIRKLHRMTGYYIAFTVIFRLLLWVEILVRPTGHNCDEVRRKRNKCKSYYGG